MIPAAFEYERAGSVDEAVALLGRGEDAKLLAGGHSLLPLMKLRLARPSVLVDIGRLSDLSYVRDAGTQLSCVPVFGSTTPQRWTATWHGIQGVVEEFLKLQYYRFYVIPILYPRSR